MIGYGKMGGKELGYASDLDLVYLFDDDAMDAEENYTRPQPAPEQLAIEPDARRHPVRNRPAPAPERRFRPARRFRGRLPRLSVEERLAWEHQA